MSFLQDKARMGMMGMMGPRNDQTKPSRHSTIRACVGVDHGRSPVNKGESKWLLRFILIPSIPVPVYPHCTWSSHDLSSYMVGRYEVSEVSAIFQLSTINLVDPNLSLNPRPWMMSWTDRTSQTTSRHAHRPDDDWMTVSWWGSMT